MTDQDLKKWCLTQAYNIVQVEKTPVNVLEKAKEIFNWIKHDSSGDNK